MNEATLSPADIEALQEAAWEETFRHAAAASPFYREHFRQAGLSGLRSLPLRDLARIPPVDKSTVSSRTAEFLCVPPGKIVEIVTTSGSTGQPLVWQLSERDLQRLGRNEALSFTCAGFTAADTVLLAVAMDRCFIAGLAYALGLRELGCAVVRAGPSTPAMHLDLIQRLRPTAVVGVPSFLALLADKAAEARMDLARLGVRKAVCIGEQIRHADFSLNRTGAAVAQGWNAQVFSTFGVTELAASLCECGAGRGGHLHPELLFLESLDDAGQPVPDGEVGELTATTFGVEAMPLIRYRTGDCAVIHRQPCPCGRQTLRIGPIVGRKNQKLKLKGTSLFPSNLKSVLDAAPGISAYVLIARRETLSADRVEVKVACLDDPGRVLAGLRERFQGEVKVAPDLTVASAAEIEQLQLPEGARKRRYFVDLRE